MASTVSFKQACPSCEALVPIRDPKLVGKKTECPKCKYRFVVEEPEEESPKKKSGDKGEKSDKTGGKKGKKEGGKKGKKSEGSGSNIGLIGIGIGGGVLVLLAGVYFLFLSGPSTPKNTNQANNTTPVTPGTTPGTDPGTNPGTTPGTNPVTPTPPRFPYAVRRDTVPDISNLLPNETEGVWNLNVEKATGSILRVVAFKTPGAFQEADFQNTFGFPLQDVQRIVVGLHSKWVYSVVRINKPVDFNELNTRLKLNKEPPENGRDWFTVGRDLDSFSNLMLKANRPMSNLALCFADSQTLVFSNRDNVLAFLNASGQFPYKSQPAAGPVPPATTPGMNPGMNPGMTDPTTIMPPGMQPMQPMQPMQGGQPIPGPGGAMQPGMGGDPNMVTPGMMNPGMMNPGMTPGTGDPNMMNPGTTTPAMPGFSGSYLTIEPHLKNVLDRAEGEKGVQFSRTLENKEIFDPKEIDRVLNQPNLPMPRVQMQLGIATAKTLVRRAAIGLQDLTEGKITGNVSVEFFNEQIARSTEQQLRTFLNLGQAPNPGGPEGGQPPIQPMQPMMPGGPMPPLDLSAFLTLASYEKILVGTANLPLPEPAYLNLKNQLEVGMLSLKSDADMANTRSRAHELAAATQKYLADKKAFPRGTAPRIVPPGALVDWAPNQRLSWVVELLPFLGSDYATLTLDPNLDWYEGDNLKAAQVALPHLIAREKPGDTYRVIYPGRPEALGPSAWVGIAGVGLDAANYRSEDTGLANKLGIFGYHRATKREDIKDDLGQTLLLIQVPASQRAPWIVGGGGTVRGVSEDTESFRPFISTQHPETKEAGTYAIMADGKVRFIKATITPEDFRALCTIAGGEKIDNLDAVAPVVPAPAGMTMEPVK